MSVMFFTPLLLLAALIVFTALYVRKNARSRVELFAVFGFYAVTLLTYLIPFFAVDVMDSDWSLRTVLVSYAITIGFTFFSLCMFFFVRASTLKTRMIWYVTAWSLSVLNALFFIIFG